MSQLSVLTLQIPFLSNTNISSHDEIVKTKPQRPFLTLTSAPGERGTVSVRPTLILTLWPLRVKLWLTTGSHFLDTERTAAGALGNVVQITRCAK